MSFKRLSLVCLFFVLLLTAAPVSAQTVDTETPGIDNKAKVTRPVEIDPFFATTIGTSGTVWDIAQVGNKTLVYYYNSSASQSQIYRLLANGKVDPSFQVANLTIYKAVGVRGHLVALPGDKILIAGNFSAVNGAARSGLARLNANGTLDSSFVAAVDNVKRIAVLPNGKILAGTRAYGTGTTPAKLVRLNADGSLDSAFNEVTLTSVEAGAFGPVDPYVEALAVQNNNKILVGGHFAAVNGELNHNNLVRLNADGSLDASFTATGTMYSGVADNKYNAPIYQITLAPGGEILVGGNFLNINGITRRAIALLTADGSLDESFDAQLLMPNRARVVVDAIVIHRNKILIGGDYLHTEDDIVGNFLRLSFDGKADANSAVRFSKDNNFRAGLVGAIAIQPGNRALVGGAFNGIFEGPKKATLQNLVRVTL